jgi:hypothetical protein
MKILVFSSLTPPATANYLVKAQRDAGHDVFVCSDVASPLASLRVRGAVDVAQVCARHGLAPDLVLFIEGGTMRLFPAGLERMSCLTAWYGIDTHMDYAKHLRIGRLFDVTFIAQKEYVERLRQDGFRQVYWLPLACAPEIYPLAKLDRCYDVAYVGSSNVAVHPVRHALLAAIRKEFPKVFLGMADPQEMGRIYAQSKIVFNKSVNNDVNMRYFEAAGAGAVLLTDPARDNGVEELFTVGAHYLEYRDEQTLLAQIRDLLQDPERCHRIADAARRHVLAHHTYRCRAARLLELAQQSNKLSPPRPEDGFPVFLALNLLDAAVACAGRALALSSGGMFGRVVGRSTALLLAGLAVVLGVLDKMRGLFRHP